MPWSLFLVLVISVALFQGFLKSSRHIFGHFGWVGVEKECKQEPESGIFIAYLFFVICNFGLNDFVSVGYSFSFSFLVHMVELVC